MIGWCLLLNLFRRRPVPLTEEQIAAIAADPERMESLYAWKDPRVIYGDDEQ